MNLEPRKIQSCIFARFAKIIEVKVKEAEPLKKRMYIHFPCDCALLAFPDVFRYRVFVYFPYCRKGVNPKKAALVETLHLP